MDDVEALAKAPLIDFLDEGGNVDVDGATFHAEGLLAPQADI